MPTRLPLYPNLTLVVALNPIMQILGGRVEPVNADEVLFEFGSGIDEEHPNNRLCMTLVVVSEEGKPVDATGIYWELPEPIIDSPEVSREWAKHCVEVMKSVVVHGKPQRALGDATAVMESMRRRELVREYVDAIRLP